MTAPDVPAIWASGAGASVVAGLTATAAEWTENSTDSHITYGLIQYTFSGSPNLSAVLAGHKLVVSGFTNAENNGTFYIVAKDNTAKTVTIRQTTRTDAALDETGASASAAINNSGAEISEPGTAKQAQGYVAGEKPSAGHFNWLFNLVTTWIVYLSNGGANILRASLTAWAAVAARAAEGLEWVQGLGALRFDPDATDTAGEGVYAPDDGDGRGFLEGAHPDAIWALLSADINESLTPVVATLDFASISAGTVGTSLTVTVPGALAGDAVMLGAPAALETGLIAFGRVSADDTVSIRLYNGTGSPINPASADWTVIVQAPNRNPAITLRGLKLYVNLLGGAYASGAALDTDLAIAGNTAAFWLLLAHRQRRRDLLLDTAAKAIIQASTTANTLMEAYEGAGY